MSISCTPHYKDDVDKPWYSREGLVNLSVWLSPKSTMSLEDLAKMIEDFLHTVHTDSSVQSTTQQTFQISMDIRFQVNIQSMSFQGENIPRAQMSTLQAKVFLRDQEPFNVTYEVSSSGTTTTTRETRGVLQSFFPCCFSTSDRNHGDTSMTSAPQAQQMNIRH